MPDTLHKIDTRAALLAWWRERRGHRLRWPPLPQWTPRSAIAALACALVFAWAFLKIVLMLIFPRAGSL